MRKYPLPDGKDAVSAAKHSICSICGSEVYGT